MQKQAKQNDLCQMDNILGSIWDNMNIVYLRKCLVKILCKTLVLPQYMECFLVNTLLDPETCHGFGTIRACRKLLAARAEVSALLRCHSLTLRSYKIRIVCIMQLEWSALRKYVSHHFWFAHGVAIQWSQCMSNVHVATSGGINDMKSVFIVLF